MEPLVSVCLPVYNAGKFLAQCLTSIEKQTYSNKELIAVNDGSTDNSLEILNNFAKGKSWVKVINNPKNLGVSATFNLAVAQSKGDFIARMDADDIMIPGRLELQVKFLQSHPQTVIVGGQCQIINESDQIIGKKTFPLAHQEIYDMLFRTVPMQQPAIMINRRLLPKDFLYADKRFSPAEDYGLFFAAASYGQFSNLSEVVLQYREHSTNISLVRPKYTFWRIWRARLNALLFQKYHPSIKSVFIVLLQTLAILIIPSRFIYRLHKMTRGMTKTAKL